MITAQCEPGAPGAPMRKARSARCVSPSIRWAGPLRRSGYDGRGSNLIGEPHLLSDCIHVLLYGSQGGDKVGFRKIMTGQEDVSARHVRARLSVRQKAISDGFLAMRHLYRILKMPYHHPRIAIAFPQKRAFGDGDARVLDNPPLLRAS